MQGPAVCYTPLGALTSPATRKLLISLICTLNASLPDYDFSDLRPDHFHNEPDTNSVCSSINTFILDPIDAQTPNFKTKFWKALDEIMIINDCEIYSYAPPDDDDLRIGKLWAVNYFWFNKTEKKVAILSASAESKLRSPLPRMGVSSMGDTDDLEELGLDDEEHCPSYAPTNYPDIGGMDGIEQTGGREEEVDDEDDEDDTTTTHYDPHCIVDLGMLDWDDLGMVERDLPGSKWMSTEQKHGAHGGAPPTSTGGINLQAVVSPVIQPVQSPALFGLSLSTQPLTLDEPLPLSLGGSLGANGGVGGVGGAGGVDERTTIQRASTFS